MICTSLHSVFIYILHRITNFIGNQDVRRVLCREEKRLNDPVKSNSVWFTFFF